jgi:hypothetical protein
MEKMKKRNDEENIKWRKLKREMALIITNSKNEKRDDQNHTCRKR